jgi:lactoylglutathione lyase
MFDDAFPIISTPDLGRSLGFYRDLLDGTVEYQFPPEGEPVYVALRIGRAEVGIAQNPEAPAGSASRFGSTPTAAMRRWTGFVPAARR